MTIKWLSKAAVTTIHRKQNEAHVGLPGLKHDNALEAALARPVNKAVCGEENLMALAAAYLFGIARNHPFSDGNKRTGFLAAYTFLLINGYEIVAEQTTVIEFVLAVAAGEIDEEGITAFFNDHTLAFR